MYLTIDGFEFYQLRTFDAGLVNFTISDRSLKEPQN